MKPNTRFALCFAGLVGLAYVAWLSFEQWNYYRGWPVGAWNQGLLEIGWPTRFFVRYWSLGVYEGESWSISCLLINSVFAAALAHAVGTVAFRMWRAVSMGSWRSFSLGSLFQLTTAVAVVFPIWEAIVAAGRVDGETQRWLLTAWPIPTTMWVLVQFGLLAAAWCLLSLAIAVIRSLMHVVRRETYEVTSPSSVTEPG